MKREDAKNGVGVEGRGKIGELIQTPTGWDVQTEKERLQSVDLSEWEVTDKPIRKEMRSADHVRTTTKDSRK